MTERRRVTFTVYGVAQPKGSTRSFAYREKRNGVPTGRWKSATTSDNPQNKSWQQLVAEGAQGVAGGGLFPGAVRLVLFFALPRPKSLPKRVTAHLKKPDLDKLTRSVKDALTGVLWRDDAQVVALTAMKTYAAGEAAPCAIITLEDLGDAPPNALPLA